jgi:hypothetical protein
MMATNINAIDINVASNIIQNTSSISALGYTECNNLNCEDFITNSTTATSLNVIDQLTCNNLTINGGNVDIINSTFHYLTLDNNILLNDGTLVTQENLKSIHDAATVSYVDTAIATVNSSIATTNSNVSSLDNQVNEINSEIDVIDTKLISLQTIIDNINIVDPISVANLQIQENSTNIIQNSTDISQNSATINIILRSG